jgi:hypothetical protein
VSVRERAEHLITLADEPKSAGLWEQQIKHMAVEGVWVARQLLEALNRIEAASGIEKLSPKHVTFLPSEGNYRYTFAAGWNEALDRVRLALNPKEADD